MYPYKKGTMMVKILSLHVITNLILSTEFIPRLRIYGASVGTIAAEMVGLIVEMHNSQMYIIYKLT